MMLLREQQGRHRLLPIYIGSPEASAIHYALEGVQPPRPLTHDLIIILLAELGASVTKVIVTETQDRTFLSEIHLTTAAGDKVISTRPSDAIAIAVRCDAPLFATDELMDAEAQEPPDDRDDHDDDDEIIDEFKDFIDNVSPEDFGA
jgi:uncharacterized protein